MPLLPSILILFALWSTYCLIFVLLSVVRCHLTSACLVQLTAARSRLSVKFVARQVGVSVTDTLRSGRRGVHNSEKEQCERVYVVAWSHCSDVILERSLVHN